MNQADSDLLDLYSATRATETAAYRLATVQASHETLHPTHLQRAEYHLRQAIAALEIAAEPGERVVKPTTY